MTETPNRSRRRVLTGVGAISATLVAGCSARPWQSSTEGTVRFPPNELEPILAAAAPERERPVPVEPDESVREDGLARTDDLLAPIPEPVDAETVPNGVVRDSIESARDTARAYDDDAVDVTGPPLYHVARNELRRSREAAREAATTLAAIDDRSLVEELSAERDQTHSAVDARLESVEYRGADTDDGRLRAALLFAAFEDDHSDALRGVERWGVDEQTDVVEIGEGAGDLEFAEATTTIWEHITERYDADVDEPIGLEAEFDDALRASIDRAESVDLPDQRQDDWLDELVAVDVEPGFTQTVLWDAVRPVYNARDGMTDAADGVQLGTGLADAVRFEQAIRAFEIVRDRVEADELASPETIEIADVRAEREAAIDAANSAQVELSGPSLGTARLAETLQSLTWTDETIRRHVGLDRETTVSVTGEYSEYVCERAWFEVLPEAVSAFRGRLLAA
ncbi:hypothetical protein ACLI4Z_11520 [Natrialbaceae archaeon A-arb3/5]